MLETFSKITTKHTLYRFGVWIGISNHKIKWGLTNPSSHS